MTSGMSCFHQNQNSDEQIKQKLYFEQCNNYRINAHKKYGENKISSQLNSKETTSENVKI